MLCIMRDLYGEVRAMCVGSPTFSISRLEKSPRPSIKIDLIRRSLATPASIDDTAALSSRTYTCYTANDASHSPPFIVYSVYDEILRASNTN